MKTKLAKTLFLAFVLGSLGVGAAQALTSTSPDRMGCPDYPGCDFGGTSFYCCDPA